MDANLYDTPVDNNSISISLSSKLKSYQNANFEIELVVKYSHRKNAFF